MAQVSYVTVEELKKLVGEGATVLDMRSPRDFAASHIPNSLCVELHEKFIPWAPKVVDTSASYVIVSKEGKEKESLEALTKIGAEKCVKGFLKGGITAWTDATSSFPFVTQEEVILGAQDVLLDIRMEKEFNTERLPGSTHIPLPQLKEKINELKAVKPNKVFIHCRTGWRGTIAASILESLDVENLHVVGVITFPKKQ